MATRTMQVIQKERRMRMVRELLCTGVSSQEEIRRLMAAAGEDIGKATISRYVKMIREEWADDVSVEDREKWRGQEVAKLDRMERALAPKCAQGVVTAIQARLGLMRHRAKLLSLYEEVPVNILVTPQVVLQRMSMHEDGALPSPVSPLLDIPATEDADYEEVNE